VVGVLPTPLDAVAFHAGIAEIVDIGKLPDELVAKKPPAWKRLLGALMFRERVAFVDSDQPEARVLFTKAHETGHRIIPWHERSFVLDHEGSLFRGTKDKLEVEASRAGAHLIFQGHRFHERALDYQLSLQAPLALVPTYGASRHATIRYYVEHHPDAVAVVIAGHYRQADGSLPIWHCIESPAFRQRFGRLSHSFPTGSLMPSDGLGQLLDEITQQALAADTFPVTDVVMPDLDGDDHDFVAEAYFNQHCLFVLFAPRRARRMGRRLRLEAS
jgi:hypothetical protein